MAHSSIGVIKNIDDPSSSIQFTPYKGSNKVLKSTEFTLTADDGIGSGLSLILYNINNTGWVTYSGSFNLGGFVISYYAIDNIGNIEDINILLGSLVKETEEPAVPGYHPVILFAIAFSITILIIKRKK